MSIDAVRAALRELVDRDTRSVNKICIDARIPNRQYLGRFLKGEYKRLPPATTLRALLKELRATRLEIENMAEASGYSNASLRTNPGLEEGSARGLPPATKFCNALLLADVRRGKRDELMDVLLEKVRDNGKGLGILASSVYGPHDFAARIWCGQSDDATRLVRWLYTQRPGDSAVPGLDLISRTETMVLLDNVSPIITHMVPDTGAQYVVVLFQAPIALRRGALIDWFQKCRNRITGTRNLLVLSAWVVLGRYDAMIELSVSPGALGSRALHRFIDDCAFFNDPEGDTGPIELRSVTLIGTRPGGWQWAGPRP